MHRAPRLRRPRVLASTFVVATAIAFGVPGPAAADAPNAIGVATGSAQSTPVTPAYENNQRPAGAGSGRKIG